MEISIDPETGNLIGQNTEDRYTAAEVWALRVPCPRCGTAVTFTPVDGGSHENATDPGRFYVGRHTFHCNCWNG